MSELTEVTLNWVSLQTNFPNIRKRPEIARYHKTKGAWLKGVGLFVFDAITQGCRFGPESRPNPGNQYLGTICGFVSEHAKGDKSATLSLF